MMKDDKIHCKEGADCIASYACRLELDELGYQLRYEVKHETSPNA